MSDQGSLLALIWGRDPDQEVAFGPQGSHGLGELRLGAQALAERMVSLPARRWALCFEDSLLFAQALLACALTGREAVLPGHQRPAALAELGAAFDAVLTDSETLGEGSDHPWLRLPLDEMPESIEPWPAPGALTLTLFTSGSTGEPKAIPKAWHQLEAELRVLVTRWGETLAGARLLASVSHQHIYGLLFRILLPLVLGLPFSRTLTRYPEQLAAQGGKWALIASPALLSRLDPGLKAPGCCLLVSSGGPLALDHARRAAQLFGVLPLEVFGSSETGGIAWRQSQTADTPWQPMPGIRVSVADEDRLLLRSPFLPDDEPLLCGDRIRLTGQGFALLGRGDRLVKLEEKRVSLDEVEGRLRALPWVTEAAVLPLTLGRRQQLGAVLVLSRQGRAQWQALGPGRFLIALREQLRPWLEPVALPRRVRCLDALPLNSQGKRPWSELKALFDEAPLPLPGTGAEPIPSRQGKRPGSELKTLFDEAPVAATAPTDRTQPEREERHETGAPMSPSALPTLLEQTPTLDGLVLRLRLDPELPWFHGHFPGAPLLPGVTQVHWAMHYGRLLPGVDGAFGGMSQLKFQRPLRPGQECELHLSWLADKGQLLFGYKVAGEHVSSGRVALCP
ncbi:AMP-binding protein [Aeromonas bivalvium]|uniref:ApeI family dehydratase n=1 Tax=Aeromonas bivalvium TaxID=440079 RepID=UPI0038CFA92A